MSDAIYKGMMLAATAASAVTWFCFFMFIISIGCMAVMKSFALFFKGPKF